MKKTTYVREWRSPREVSGMKRAIVVELDEPISIFGHDGESRYLCVIATQFPEYARVNAYHIDEDGRGLSVIPLVEGWNTLSLRETMTEAGYDVSSWPENIA